MIIIAARPEGFVIFGLSTETKPSECPTNSLFFEVDTGKSFVWINLKWKQNK